MNDLKHKRVQTNGIWMHIVEQGTGPLVFLLHGFPEFWFGWRHQITPLVNAGYHVVVPDMRGYGDTDSPPLPSSYTVIHLVDDIIGLLDHFNQQEAFVVGHDWGAFVGWYICLFKPDRVRGFVSLSVPFIPRPPNVESLTQRFTEGFHISHFQKQGRAEKSFARYDYLTVIKKFLLIKKDDLLIAPPGLELIDFLETPPTPEWITEEELQCFADKFQESGFTGPLNYYRALDLNFELLAPWEGAKVTVPTKYIVGDKDLGFESAGTKDYVQGEVFKSLVPNLQIVIIDGHHYIHQEKAKEVTDEILSFFQSFQ